MKVYKLSWILAGLLAATVHDFVSAKTAVPDENLKVVLIRHGEKPADGYNLSCQGESRALQLPAVLYAKFNVPAYTYVPSLDQGKATKHARMFQTVTPFAIKYNLTLNSKFDEKDVKGVAADVRGKSGTVLMVWEHSAIPPIAQALGVQGKLEWEKDDFDSIWIVTFSGGKALLTKDQENIVPSADCNF